MAKTVELKKDMLTYMGPIDLTQYYLQSFSFMEGVNTPHNDNGLQIRLVLKRRVLSEILTTFLPTILIIVVSFSTTFFDVRQFPNQP